MYVHVCTRMAVQRKHAVYDTCTTCVRAVRLIERAVGVTSRGVRITPVAPYMRAVYSYLPRSHRLTHTRTPIARDKFYNHQSAHTVENEVNVYGKKKKKKNETRAVYCVRGQLRSCRTSDENGKTVRDVRVSLKIVNKLREEKKISGQ